ncbi:hypothetical protein WDW37_09390 [Bdellovibrionota bacterium FG-1]
MQRPLFPSIASGDFSAIINLALHELGLNENFFLRAFIAAKGKPKIKDGEWDIGAVGVTEWIWICKKLYLPLDCISIGYSRMWHRAWVGRAILEGAYVLPWTDQARSLFREYIAIERRSIRDQKNHYGRELLRKVIGGRREEAKARRMMRKQNLRTGESARKKYQKYFIQSAIGPLMIQPEPSQPLRKSHRPCTGSTAGRDGPRADTP